MEEKKLGNFQLRFPSTWTTCAFEGNIVNSGLLIKGNSDTSIDITFRNKYTYLPLVVPVVSSTTNTWGYIIAMLTMLTKTSCNLNFHNYSNTDLIVSVGYIIVG